MPEEVPLSHQNSFSELTTSEEPIYRKKSIFLENAENWQHAEKS